MARHNEDTEQADITAQLQPLVDDDALLTSLSEGVDPSDGNDDLAALFLELREDVERQMPPAPVVEGADDEPAVISLGKRRKRRPTSPWIAGLVGAAAATVVVAGSGAALYNATPESPLWNASTAVFGDRTAVVELAGTLDDMQIAADNGDIESTRQLLGQARSLVDEIKDPSATTQSSTRQAPRPTVTVTQTETVEAPAAAPGEPAAPGAPAREPVTTATVTEVAPAPAARGGGESSPETVTVAETQVATVTVTAPGRQNPIPAEQGQGQGGGSAPTEPAAPGAAPEAGAPQGEAGQVEGPQSY